jgi:tetratricopeptide (TPR) repeat protein
MITPIRTLYLFSVLVATLFACTPKTTDQTQTTTPTPPAKPVVSTDPCAKFSDSKAGEAALDAHVIYRDFIRRKEFQQAIPYWRQAFNAAPAADGQRTTHFDDGILIYDHLISQQSTLEGKKLYLDSIFYLYDRMNACYPEIAYADGKKAFDLYYNYRELSDNKTIFNLFTKVLDKKGLETPAFVINPFTALLVEMFTAKEIDQATAVKYAEQILAISEKQAENMKDGWPIVIGYAPAQLEVFETVPGFFPCSHFNKKYYASVNLDSIECDDISIINTQLKRGLCPDDDPAFARLEAEFRERCIDGGPDRDSSLICGQSELEKGRYAAAIRCYKEYISRSEDPATRARYNLFVAKIYYGSLKRFPEAREHARLALRDRPNMGDAYMLIGKLYASSGPLCGPGRGWDSQIVTWPAIDMFAKAKQVDPRVTSEANRLITTYSRYMPGIEEIFQRQLSEGQTFFVGCWIQENTTIRAARE